jgi:hypothetical protein
MADPYWKLERGLPPVRLRSMPDGGTVLYGRFVAAGEWTEIKSRDEGHFFETTNSRAFAVSIHANRDQIRCLYHHGLDPAIGTKPLGVIRQLDADSSYEVDLFDDADYVRSLVPGLRASQYGASFRCRPIKDEIEPHPPAPAGTRTGSRKCGSSRPTCLSSGRHRSPPTRAPLPPCAPRFPSSRTLKGWAATQGRTSIG